MPKIIPTLIAAAFVTVTTFAAFAADEEQSGAPAVEQAANPIDQDGQGDAQATATDDQEVTSPLPTGGGRSDNQ